MASKSTGSKVKRVFVISDEAIRRCSEAGLRVMMPVGETPNEPGKSFAFELLESGSLVVTVTQHSVSKRILLPSVAFMAELA